MNSRGLKRWAARIHWTLAEQFGIDLRRMIRSPFGLLGYLRDLARFRCPPGQRMVPLPCLHDRWEQAGAVSSEYFWQDLLVARMIRMAAPDRHVDVGSRLDGFVAHVASFRDLEVFDVRPLSVQIPGVTFRQADVMDVPRLPAGITDSLSCLHAIEHFGLGRYGDPLDPDGMRKGLRGLARLVAPGGRLYLACPAGEDIVYFNAHRAIRPPTLVAWAAAEGFMLASCQLFDHRKKAFERVANVAELHLQAEQTLALYVFDKSTADSRG